MVKVETAVAAARHCADATPTVQPAVVTDALALGSALTDPMRLDPAGIAPLNVADVLTVPDMVETTGTPVPLCIKSEDVPDAVIPAT